jgi:hypothetical protein
LPGIEESFSGSAGQAAGYSFGTSMYLTPLGQPSAVQIGFPADLSLHAGVAAAAQQRDKLERLCRYIALQGCRVLRRLGTIASAPDLPYLKSGCH